MDPDPDAVQLGEDPVFPLNNFLLARFDIFEAGLDGREPRRDIFRRLGFGGRECGEKEQSKEN